MAETFLYEVSIHALLAECDFIKGRKAPERESFNPRTPCGVRPGSMIVSVSPVGFQSTHSLRSATKTPSYFVYDDYVSIHALLAECDYTQPACPPRSGVSIHALLAECDILPTGEIAPLVKFQSTHSLRSATSCTPSGFPFNSVSIHALLAECDRIRRLTWFVRP